jgi:hypothetical protein
MALRDPAPSLKDKSDREIAKNAQRGYRRNQTTK